MSDNPQPREHERISLKLKAELCMPDKKVYAVTTGNVGLGGSKLHLPEVDSNYIGKIGLLRLIVQSDPDPILIELQCRIVWEDETGIGLEFFGIDEKRYQELSELLKNGSINSVKIQQEIKNKFHLSVSTLKTKLFQDQLSAYIVEIVNDTFIAFLTLTPKPGPSVASFADEVEYEPPQSDATAMIHFNGAISGGIHLSAPLHVALALSGSFAQHEFERMDEMAVDAFGELANLVAGGVQTRLSGDFEDINLTPPVVVLGEDFAMAYKSDLSSVKQYFMIKKGPFFVECFFSG